MDLLIILFAGLAVTGALVARQKPIRFQGDRAKRGDLALVESDAFRTGVARADLAIPAGVGVAVRVDNATDENFVSGPIVGYVDPATPDAQIPGAIRYVAPTSNVQLPRQYIWRVMRNGDYA